MHLIFHNSIVIQAEQYLFGKQVFFRAHVAPAKAKLDRQTDYGQSDALLKQSLFFFA